MMKCSVFIATSADGYIATKDGGVAWLESAGKHNVDMGHDADMGMNRYIASVDCMIMGRKCMEIISSFNLTAEQWPYGDIKIIALSNTLTAAPDNLKDKVEMYSGDIHALITRLENDGYQHAYVDGGATITTFINLKLINEMTITKAPVLLGEGIPLFGKLDNQIALTDVKAHDYPNGFAQLHYKVSYQ
jgi:dihydrofolate reductase